MSQIEVNEADAPANFESPAPATPAPLLRHLDRKQELLDGLDHAVSVLEKRLSPVSRSIKQDETTVANDAEKLAANDANSPVIQRLASQNIRLSDIKRRVMNVIDKLEV